MSQSVPFFDLTTQFEGVRQEVEQKMDDVLESQYFILGPEVEEFEQTFAGTVGVEHAVGCASGTDALLLALKALDPQPGEEVIIPSFTFFATAGAVWNAGFRPVFCDVDADTFNVTAGTVEAADATDVRAVVPVDLYGQMAPVEEIRSAESLESAFLLEDAAQATGAARQIDGEVVMAGAAGDAGAFSFFPTKNLGGFGDGGMITTDDAAFAERLRKLRVHGGVKMYHHEFVGTNSRLDTLQAAVLLGKLPYLDEWIRARRANAALYNEMLSDVDGVRTPGVAAGNHHTYNQYTLRAERRDDLRAFLSDREIGTGVYYPVPLHLQECFSELGYREGQLPVSERLCTEVLSLPVFPELGEDRVRIVAEAVREFYGA